MNKQERQTAFEKGKRIFRIRHLKTGAWWEGVATDATRAILFASHENSTFESDNIEIREYTSNGGWKKCT